MTEEKKDWTNDSDDVDMDWATEAETAEAQAELERREAAQVKDGAAAEPKVEAKKTTGGKSAPWWPWWSWRPWPWRTWRPWRRSQQGQPFCTRQQAPLERCYDD